MKKKIPSPLEMKFSRMQEADLHQYFYEKMINDFDMEHEVKGRCNLNHPAIADPSVVADFLMYPREHLLELGFADTWFAVEIKALCNRWSLAMKQAFWYTVSTFEIKDRLIVPAFSVAFLPEVDPGSYGNLDESDLCRGEAMAFGHMNTGFLRIYEKKYYNWEICFGSDRYARSYNDRATGKIAYHIDQGRKAFHLKIGNGQQICAHSGIDGNCST